MAQTFRIFLICLLLALPCVLQADFYQWQDKAGGWHIADSIGKVPPEYRGQVKVEKVPESPGGAALKDQKATSKKGRKTKAKPLKAFVTQTPAPKRYTIPYRRTPGVLHVNVSINGRRPISLILDTGASFIVLSREAAKEVGVSFNGVLPRIRTSTANGTTENYLVRLSSVELGGARVEHVAALVPVKSQIGTNGLLGQNFLNEFEWSNDTTRGVLVLKEASNFPGEELYCGHGKMWWSKKFANAKGYLKREREILRVMKDYDPNGPMEKDSIDGQIQIQKANADFFHKDFEILDTKASRCMVPRSWR